MEQCTCRAGQVKQRLEWVDACKGFAMLLILIWHTDIYAPIQQWAGLFHVPLFFFLSGYVFSANKYQSFHALLKNKLRTLFVPLILLGFILTSWGWCLNPKEPYVYSMGKRIVGIFIQLRGGSYDMGLWFITCLLVTEMVYWIIFSAAKGKPRRIAAMLVMCSAIGFAYVRLIDHICPWSLEASMIAVGFFGAGHLYRSYAEEKLANWENYGTLLLLFLITIVVVFVNLQAGTHPDLYADDLTFYPLYYCGAFSGIAMSVQLFKKLGHTKGLQFIGRNTLVYYAFHGCCFATFEKVTGISQDNSLVSCLFIAGACLICGVIAVVMNRYFPWVLGKKPSMNAEDHLG